MSKNDAVQVRTKIVYLSYNAYFRVPSVLAHSLLKFKIINEANMLLLKKNYIFCEIETLAVVNDSIGL